MELEQLRPWSHGPHKAAQVTDFAKARVRSAWARAGKDADMASKMIPPAEWDRIKGEYAFIRNVSDFEMPADCRVHDD